LLHFTGVSNTADTPDVIKLLMMKKIPHVEEFPNKCVH